MEVFYVYQFINIYFAFSSGLVSELGLLAPYLEILYLQDNKIEGKIPSEFGLLTNLRKVRVCFCLLTLGFHSSDQFAVVVFVCQ